MSDAIDLLVIGAGACGLAAAIAAHDAGAQVAIVEKLDRPGGNRHCQPDLFLRPIQDFREKQVWLIRPKRWCGI